MNAGDATATLTALLEAFSAADFDRMRELFAEDVASGITNAEGGTDVVSDRETLLGRIEAMNLPAVGYSVELTQEPVAVGDDRAMAMVEIRAKREDRTLHNFAAHLVRVVDGRITEWSMVDAKPAESDRFWA